MSQSNTRNFFQARSRAISLHRRDTNNDGLRNSQFGAVHAIAAHFTTSNRPGIISMPTGSGKTEVMILAPFVLGVERVLVISSGRLICDQLEEKFRSLSILPDIDVLDVAENERPEVIQVPKRRQDERDWMELVGHDVAIGTPHRTAPAYPSIEEPPEDLFDLVLVDEGHHAPAKTWQSVIDSFPQAKKLLFTATPFRRDGKRLPGEIVYHYPLRQAIDDEIFSELDFIEVERQDGAELDVTLAKKAEQILIEDRSRELNHYIVARASKRSKCDKLFEIYETNTELSMRVLHSRHSQTYARRTIELLENGELDGLICADMLGEGFDFPNLKIAVLHDPYRSLAPTLQFIGRFARVNAAHIGSAKFVAARQRVSGPVDQLFERDAAWTKLIPGLVDRAVDQEESRDNVAQDVNVEQTSGSIIEELSVYGLSPYFHVKCFRLADASEPERAFEFRDWDLAQESAAGDRNLRILLLEQTFRPRWTRQSTIQNRVFALVILYVPAESEILFVCSSEKQATIYTDIQRAYAQNDNESQPTALSGHDVKKVYHLLENIDFFNVGMRAYASRGTDESYRILTGRKADESVSRSDALRFHGGHLFGKGETEDGSATVGTSPSGKIWSSNRGGIAELMVWCDGLAAAIATAQEVETQTNLDVLCDPVPVSEFPTSSEEVINIEWPPWIFEQAPDVKVDLDDGTGPRTICALDFNIRAQSFRESDTTGELVFQSEQLEFTCAMSLDGSELLQVMGGVRVEIEKDGEENWADFAAVFSDDPFLIQFIEFSQLRGREFVEYPSGDIEFPSSLMEEWDWSDVDITLEEPSDSEDGRISIHEFFQERLCQDCDGCVIYDQGAGEIADLLTIVQDENTVKVSLYHCKASQGSAAGARVADFDVVCAQTLRSLKYLRTSTRFFERLEHRLGLQQNEEKLVQEGDVDLARLMTTYAQYEFEREIVIVQPGLSKSGISDRLELLLGAVNEHVVSDIGREIEVICSQ